MASSRERRLESAASAANVAPEVEEDTALPQEPSMNQGTETYEQHKIGFLLLS